HALHVEFAQQAKIRPAEHHRSRLDPAVVRQQAQQRKRGHRLAAARFADQRERLAPVDRDRQRVHGSRKAALGLEHRAQPTHGQHRLGDGAHAGAGLLRSATLFSRARGSNASRTASAKRFAGRTIRNMNTNAAASAHQITGVAESSRRAVLIITPKLKLFGSTPTPTYDSTASASTKPENCITVLMRTIGATFGRMCRMMTRAERTPNACAAWMYSSSRSFIVSPRTRRHSPVNEVMPRIRHRKNSRASLRSSAVWNRSGLVSIFTCSSSTAAAISSTSGIDASSV